MKPTILPSSAWRCGFLPLILMAMVAVLAQCRRKSDEAPPSTRAEKTRPAANPIGDFRRSAPRPSAALSADDLVAIYQKSGAAAALEAAKALPGPERDQQVLFILGYLTRTDPEFVANELKTAGLSAFHQGVVVDATLSEWKDGRKALAWADTQLTGQLRLRAVAKALGILVRTDPQAALAHLGTLPESDSRRQAICDLFGAWGALDPNAALRQAGQLPADEAESAIRYVLNSWARTHPDDVAAWLKASPSPSANQIRDVFLSWPADAKTSAQAWFDSLPESPAKAEAKTGIDQAASNTFAKVCGPATAPDESWRTKAVSEMKPEDLRNWAYQDKAGARRFLEQSPDNPALTEMVCVVAACMSADESPQAAFDWALKLSPGLKADALRLAVVSWVMKDPAAAAEKTFTLPADHRAPLTLAIAENWTRQDPAAGAAWVAGLSESNQPELVVKVLEQWAGMEPEKAYGWLGTLPAGAARDGGISLMIRREARHDPASLLPWVDQISQAKLQQDMKTLIQAWMKNP